MDKSTWFLNLSCLNLIHTRYYIETNGFYKTIWQNIRQIAFSCSHVQIVPCLMFDILFYTLNNITFMRFLKLFYECFIPISKIWIVRALKLKYRKIMLICIGVAYKIVLQFLLTNTKKKTKNFYHLYYQPEVSGCCYISSCSATRKETYKMKMWEFIVYVSKANKKYKIYFRFFFFFFKSIYYQNL